MGWIAFALLTTGMLVQALPRSPAGSSDSNKEGVPAFVIKNDIKKIQESLRDKGHYQGKVDGVVGLRTRARFAHIRRLRISPSLGKLIPGLQMDSESGLNRSGAIPRIPGTRPAKLATGLAMRSREISLRQAFGGLRLEPTRLRGR